MILSNIMALAPAHRGHLKLQNTALRIRSVNGSNRRSSAFIGGYSSFLCARRQKNKWPPINAMNADLKTYGRFASVLRLLSLFQAPLRHPAQGRHEGAGSELISGVIAIADPVDTEGPQSLAVRIPSDEIPTPAGLTSRCESLAMHLVLLGVDFEVSEPWNSWTRSAAWRTGMIGLPVNQVALKRVSSYASLRSSLPEPP